MDHADHVALIRAGVLDAPPSGERRRCGRTSAPGAAPSPSPWPTCSGRARRIVAVDRDAGALRTNAAAVADAVPGHATCRTLVADLDGTARPAAARRPGRGQQPALRAARPAGRRRSVAWPRRSGRGAPFIVVEYDADRGNPWVPHPFSAATWATPGDAAASRRRRSSAAFRAGSSGRSTRRSSRPAERGRRAARCPPALRSAGPTRGRGRPSADRSGAGAAATARARSGSGPRSVRASIRSSWRATASASVCRPGMGRDAIEPSIASGAGGGTPSAAASRSRAARRRRGSRP